MIIHKPYYYKDFKCIGSACQDTCCAGWEIEIDEATADKYHTVEGELGKRLKSNITETDEEIYFNLQEGKRCPFLNQENLCDLIIGIGEEYLCDICREHPRHYEWFGDYTEVGVGLCCEEAGRLLFENSNPIYYIEEIEWMDDDSELVRIDDSSEETSLDDEKYIQLLLAARNTAFSIIQNRELALKNRLKLLLQYAEELQEALDVDDYDSMIQSMNQYQSSKLSSDLYSEETFELVQTLLTIYGKLESLDESWPRRMQTIQNMIDNHLMRTNLVTFFCDYPNALAYEYEHFAMYLLYRYFMQALFDGDLLGKIKFVVMSIIILTLMDGETYSDRIASGKQYSLRDRINNAKQYSKEVEYCTENMDALASMCWEESCMSTESLVHMLDWIFEFGR